MPAEILNREKIMWTAKCGGRGKEFTGTIYKDDLPILEFQLIDGGLSHIAEILNALNEKEKMDAD